MSEEYLLLKWGTLKGWNFEDNEKAQKLMEKYLEMGMSMGAMQQKDTPEQKQLICDIIDVVNCEIQNDWSGEIMTKDEAKKYVMDYK